MILEGPLYQAQFIDRPNRFLIHVTRDGQHIACHLPDPGRLKELLVPGAEVWIRFDQKPGRKTAATAVLVRAESPEREDGPLVCLVSALPNRFVRELLEAKTLPGFEHHTLIRAEVPYHHHRFDFLLHDPDGTPYYLEVKSVTYVKNRVARFPDAVTKRGREHALTLASIRRKGWGAGIVFICQRTDAEEFRPMWDRDPQFARALADAAEAGVEIHCFTTIVRPESMHLSRKIPVYLPPE
jgi:sugar fermentation stimulation protein A